MRKFPFVYKYLIRTLLFLLPAETAHHVTFSLTRMFYRIPGVSALVRAWCGYSHPDLARTVFGLEFPNPIGIAAGFDKDAMLIDPLADMGFGFVEIGTVTPRPQVGNPQPRLFRLPADQGLINRMGFNNRGMEAAAERLKKRKSSVIIGGNIGKNKITPNHQAVEDYIKCFDQLFPWVDYFVVNVSSPNTPGLRELQEKEPLLHLLNALQDRNGRQEHPKPILLKIAPDLTHGQLDDIIEIVQSSGTAGIVATNTTVERSGLNSDPNTVQKAGQGGLSGAPLKDMSTEVIRYLSHKSHGSIPIIGVGGVFTVQDAWEKLQAGACLVQVYTGFIYEGPLMVKRLNKGLQLATSKSP